MADERGSGPISAIFGLGVFLGFLLIAVQLILNLYATSMVTAVAFDAARLAAGSGSGVDEAAARAHVSSLLGQYEAADALQLDIGYAGGTGGVPDEVRLHVVAEHPIQLLPNVSFPYQVVDRTIKVRVEEFR